MTHDPHHAAMGDRLFVKDADLKWAQRQKTWESMHPEERTCGCGAILSRYNMGKVCGPCRRTD